MEDVFGQAKLFRGGRGFLAANNIETVSGWQIEQYIALGVLSFRSH